MTEYIYHLKRTCGILFIKNYATYFSFFHISTRNKNNRHEHTQSEQTTQGRSVYEV